VLLSHRKRKVFWGDFKTVDDIETPNSRLKYWHASQNVITEQKKTITSLRQINEKLLKQVKTLNNLIDHLKNDKKIISDNCFSVIKVSKILIDN